MQERRNSIANVQDLHLSCTNPSIYIYKPTMRISVIDHMFIFSFHIVFIYRYHSALDVRRRMDANLFTETIQAMMHVSSGIDEYIELSRSLTTFAFTSPYKLIKETLQRFQEVLLDDFNLIFRYSNQSFLYWLCRNTIKTDQTVSEFLQHGYSYLSCTSG